MRRREDLTGYWQAKERGDMKARAYLVEHYLKLVTATRKRLFPQIGERFMEELEAEGRLMLVRCVDVFDRGRGVQFPSYAITKIRGAMTEYLRKEDWTPRVERQRERRGEPALIREVVSLEEAVLTDAWGDVESRLEDRIPDTKTPVEQQVIERLEAERLRALVNCLPKVERAVVRLYYYEERTLKQVAGDRHRSEARMHQRHHEALEHLRNLARWVGMRG
jgi:RNA polymerase sigma factor for flagellar operon FliA